MIFGGKKIIFLAAAVLFAVTGAIGTDLQIDNNMLNDVEAVEFPKQRTSNNNDNNNIRGGPINVLSGCSRQGNACTSDGACCGSLRCACRLVLTDVCC